jgi:serine/threonine protein kinase
MASHSGTNAATAGEDNWERLQALFHLAVDAPENERASLLVAACDDPELRAQVMALLAADDVVAVEEPSPTPIALTGKIGPYTLLRLLGSGGIGSVYLVERTVDDILLRSALKVLGPHAAGPMFVERFLRERKILASLNHPNITRLLDAGLTENSQPYLVMEYVEGEHLTAYCDSRNLGINERLRLFLEVCKAVAHAHRSLVVHLDLKPSNILVTADGTVKLLDFGTSKLLQQDSLMTGTVMATPGYASPEQLRNEHLTTASDMYSLGVILYELLSGSRPGGKASAAVMLERAITEREPERLTDSIAASAPGHRGLTEQRLRQLLRGDLATIVAKCLRPRAANRYASLDALAEDLQRYLNGWPVLARPQTTLYLVGKYVRRKRKAVIAASIVLVLILASLGYAEWRQRQAILEGQRALRMQTFLYRLLYLANSNYTGKPTFTVPDFLNLGVKLLPNYIHDPADLRKAQMSLAESMYENNDLDGAATVFAEVIPSAIAANDYDVEAESEATAGEVAYLQGKPDLGLQWTTHALELSKRQGVLPGTRLWAKVYYATNRDRLGFRSAETLAMLKSAAQDAKKDGLLPPHEVGDVFYSLGWDQKLRENYPEAEAAYTQALQVYQNDPAAACDLSAVYGELAAVKNLNGDPQGSLPLYKQAYDGLTNCEGSGSRGALEQQARMGGALIELGRAKEAVPMLEASMPAWRKISGSSPDLAEPLLVLARAYLNTGKFDDAAKASTEAIAVQTGKVAANDRRIGSAHLYLAMALLRQLHYAEALPHAQMAAGILTHGVTGEPQKADAEARQALATAKTKTQR